MSNQEEKKCTECQFRIADYSFSYGITALKCRLKDRKVNLNKYLNQRPPWCPLKKEVK